MNLFVLHEDPVIAARMNCDKHVCKIILEAAQMMCLAHIHTGSTLEHLWDARTHRNNHVSIWVRTTTANYEWTARHGLALCDEYTQRYGKVHKTQSLIQWCADNVPPIPVGGLTPFRQAVPEELYGDDVVQVYREYYVKYKSYFARWRRGNVPEWYLEMLTASQNLQH